MRGIVPSPMYMALAEGGLPHSVQSAERNLSFSVA